MTLSFTEEESKYIIVIDKGEYRLKCADNAPENIKKSIGLKLSRHKEWLREMGWMHEQDR